MKIACYIRNPTVYEQVRGTLVRAGFESIQFDSENALLRTLTRRTFDLILIDVALPPRDDDGIFPGWASAAATTRRR